jgi:hypothetical protein
LSLPIIAGIACDTTTPANLPVVQSSKFDLAINASTARILGLTLPPSLLAIADKVMNNRRDVRCSHNSDLSRCPT